MKKTLLLLFLILSSKFTHAQISGNFTVNGDIDKFYPVTFLDGGWGNNEPTKLTLGRSSVHLNSDWRGSLMASFSYHVTAWGNGSNFIDANIKPSFAGGNTNFIASWRDATPNGICQCIIIWLRGGGTTYYYQSNYAVNPAVYDGIQNPLPYNEVNGPAHTFKITPDDMATTSGVYQNRDTYYAAKVGIGTINPDEKLTVNGKIHAKEVRIDLSNPMTVPDYVFANDYKLKSLQEVEAYIKQKQSFT